MNLVENNNFSSLNREIQLGGSLSVGIDIDPQAIASTRQNAALNNILPEKLQLHLVPRKNSPAETTSLCGVAEAEGSNEAEVIPDTEKYDVVVANILLNPLLDLAENIVSYGKPGAIVGLSGILSEQVTFHKKIRTYLYYGLQQW